VLGASDTRSSRASETDALQEAGGSRRASDALQEAVGGPPCPSIYLEAVGSSNYAKRLPARRSHTCSSRDMLFKRQYLSKHALTEEY
jgi:hypothetical protein